MDRLKLIQKLIDKRGFKTYLEIGVFVGWVFFKIKCFRKIAVDPEFKFNWKGRLGETIRNPYNLLARFYEKKSDNFFSEDASKVFRKDELDIVLVDGLHEFNHALNDVLNSLEYLAPNGVIIMHDCNPQLEEEACSYDEWKARGSNGNWLGDVWKCIPYLRDNRPDLDVFVVDCDLGLGIITKKNLNGEGRLDERQKYKAMSYSDLKEHRNSILNLKSEMYLDEFFFK